MQEDSSSKKKSPKEGKNHASQPRKMFYRPKRKMFDGPKNNVKKEAFPTEPSEGASSQKPVGNGIAQEGALPNDANGSARTQNANGSTPAAKQRGRSEASWWRRDIGKTDDLNKEESDNRRGQIVRPPAKTTRANGSTGNGNRKAVRPGRAERPNVSQNRSTNNKSNGQNHILLKNIPAKISTFTTPVIPPHLSKLRLNDLFPSENTGLYRLFNEEIFMEAHVYANTIRITMNQTEFQPIPRQIQRKKTNPVRENSERLQDDKEQVNNLLFLAEPGPDELPPTTMQFMSPTNDNGPTTMEILPPKEKVSTSLAPLQIEETATVEKESQLNSNKVLLSSTLDPETKEFHPAAHSDFVTENNSQLPISQLHADSKPFNPSAYEHTPKYGIPPSGSRSPHRFPIGHSSSFQERPPFSSETGGMRPSSRSPQRNFPSGMRPSSRSPQRNFASPLPSPHSFPRGHARSTPNFEEPRKFHPDFAEREFTTERAERHERKLNPAPMLSQNLDERDLVQRERERKLRERLRGDPYARAMYEREIRLRSQLERGRGSPRGNPREAAPMLHPERERELTAGAREREMMLARERELRDREMIARERGLPPRGRERAFVPRDSRNGLDPHELRALELREREIPPPHFENPREGETPRERQTRAEQNYAERQRFERQRAQTRERFFIERNLRERHEQERYEAREHRARMREQMRLRFGDRGERMEREMHSARDVSRRPGALPSSQLASAHSHSQTEEWERFERHRAQEMHKRRLRAEYDRRNYYPPQERPARMSEAEYFREMDYRRQQAKRGFPPH